MSICGVEAGSEIPQELLGGDYNLLPYRSVPYQQTQPTHLAALGQLFGLNPPAPDKARILELGCAAGGNIMPVAALYSETQSLGIDLSERQVEDGNARIKALKLKNIEIRHDDIARFQTDGEQFDYIICHGVYSWIPPEAQDAVFRIAAETLTDGGILYVSYNTYPGWHLRTIVRDICQYHAGGEGEPKLRVARARWVLEQLANMSNEASPYGQLLRNEAKLNARLPDSYILGEFLATHNEPCFFHEFIARAAERGMHFFSETDLASSIPESLDAETAKLVRQIAGDSGSALEQYMDFFAGRQFRRSLLVRKSDVGRINRSLTIDRIANLHLASLLRHDEGASKDGQFVFTGQGGAIRFDQPVLNELLTYMQEAFPDTRTLKEILEYLSSKGLVNDKAMAGEVVKVLFNLITGGKVRVSATPLKSGRASDRKPVLWALAMAEIKAGQNWVSSRSHAPIGVDKKLRALLPHVDGKHTHKALQGKVIDALKAGDITVKGLEANPKTSRKSLEPAAKQILSKFLKYLEHHALLAPQ